MKPPRNGIIENPAVDFFLRMSLHKRAPLRKFKTVTAAAALLITSMWGSNRLDKCSIFCALIVSCCFR